MTPKEGDLLKEIERAIRKNPTMAHYIYETLVVNRTRTSFKKDYVEAAGPRAYAEGAGLILGNYFEGRGDYILFATHAALEDANWHKDAEKLRWAFPRTFPLRGVKEWRP
jgi:hypothetical protein